MPRMSAAEKQRSHNRILDAAARLFRENGIASTSVADVMEGAGMTHGGFYRHFESKEDLVAAAFRRAVDGVVQDIEQEATADSRKRARDAYIDAYLSQQHVRDRGRGCPLAAMGADLARIGDGPQHEGAAAVERMARLLQQSGDDRNEQGLAMMALMVGSITLARLAETKTDTEEVLDAGRTGLALLEKQWPAA